ncbi:hypothetical protein [Sharpea azabuensis]|uniref:hypothetical protein n=1 Tax=Sharpea azabuensis TaxID=322505 RepID=UPI0015685298|nr:hypothetical protein [Sharpea azabuensis]
MSWGQCVSYFRVPSQSSISVKKTTIVKMTRQKYNSLLIEAKINDWLKKNPRPIEYNPLQPDLFEAEFMLPWIVKHTEAREKIINFVNQIGNKVKVYARYKGDVGYPRKIMEFKSDHQKLMILDGAYANHLWSKSIQKGQRTANILAKINPDFIALKVVDGKQECILVPSLRLKEVA